MSRDIETDISNALDDSVVRPFFLVSLELDASTLRYSTLSYDLSWDSETWLGNGYIKEIGAIRESNTGGAEGLQVTLLGEVSALVAIALANVQQNKPASLYLGLLDTAGDVIDDPILLFDGYVDRCNLNDEPGETSVTFFAESQLDSKSDPAGLRTTNEAQQKLFSGDKGFEFVLQMQNWDGYFGNRKNKHKGKRKRRDKQ